MKALVLILALSACDTTYTTITNINPDGSTQDSRLIGTWKNTIINSDEAISFRADGTLFIEDHASGISGAGCITHTLTDGLWANESSTTLTLAWTAEKSEITGCTDAAGNMPLQGAGAPLIYSASYLVHDTTLVLSNINGAATVYTRQ